MSQETNGKQVYVVHPKGKISTWHTPQCQRKGYQVMCWGRIDKRYAFACLPVTNEKLWLKSEEIFRAINSSLYLPNKTEVPDERNHFPLVNVCSNSIPFRPDAHKRGRKILVNKNIRKIEKEKDEEEKHEDSKKRRIRICERGKVRENSRRISKCILRYDEMEKKRWWWRRRRI